MTTKQEEDDFEARIEFRNPPKESTPIMEKIKKLLNLAKNKAATEHEAATSATFAQKLMAQHKIEEHDLHPDRIEEYDLGAFLLEPRSQIHNGWHKVLAWSICKNNWCTGVYVKASNGFKIVGLQRDAQVVFYLYQYLHKEIDRIAREAEKQRWDRTKCETWIASFCHGAVRTVDTRLIEEHQRAATEDKGFNALVLRSKTALQKAKNELIGRTVMSRPLRVGDAAAFAAGRRAGHGISLRHGVTGSGGGPKQIG